MVEMNRRAFILALGGGVSLPCPAAQAQQGRLARIGFLGLDSEAGHAPRVAALRGGLRDLGWVEGKNLQIEFRWADSNYDRLPVLLDELVRLKVDVLATHTVTGALAAKRATATIPIVITAAADLLALGIVQSLSRPGGNLTGLSFFNAELMAKRLELMKEAIPALTRAAVLLNPDVAANPLIRQEIEPTAKALSVELHILEARPPGDLERAFAAMADRRIEAVVVHEEPALAANTGMIADLAAAQRIALSGDERVARAGGIIGYGVNLPDTDYRAAALIDKILKGAKAGDLPIERSSKFTVVVNLKAAKAIGLTLPTSILLRADEVIE